MAETIYKTIVEFKVEDPKRVLDLYRHIPRNARNITNGEILDAEEEGDGAEFGYIFYRILMDCAFWVQWDRFLVAEFGRSLDRNNWKEVFGVYWTWVEEGNE